jgi:hypothetical protein
MLQKTEGWSEADRIRWIQYRIWDVAVKNGKYTDDRARWIIEKKAAGGRQVGFGDAVSDYAIWLLKVRDKLSWHQIAYRCFREANEANIETLESRVRRKFNSVERRHPGSASFVPRRLTKKEKLVLEILTSGVMSI